MDMGTNIRHKVLCVTALLDKSNEKENMDMQSIAKDGVYSVLNLLQKDVPVLCMTQDLRIVLCTFTFTCISFLHVV